MLKNVLLTLAMGLAVAGCFENRSKPADVPTVIGLDALAKTNRAEVVRLYLRGTKVAIPADALANLPKLEALDLSECNIREVPEGVCALSTLRDFYFVRNGAEKLPVDLAKLKNLRYLNLDGNRFTAVPEVVVSLTSLKFLRLNENKLKEVPASLSALKGLKRLYLRRNQLSSVPEVVKNFAELEDLALDYNAITEVPAWLAAMSGLKAVSFAGCKISKLPEDLSAWKKLNSLVLSGCPIPESEIKRIRAALPDVAMLF